MQHAVASVLEGRLGHRRAASEYMFPQTTLERKVKVGEARQLAEQKPHHLKRMLYRGRGAIGHIFKENGRAFVWISDSKFKTTSIPHQWAEKLGKSNRWENSKNAGKDWLMAFMARHPKLSIRKPEPTTVARAMGFNHIAVGQLCLKKFWISINLQLYQLSQKPNRK
ncbi:helix-turn-helix psq domain [Holotrichia oblita]|uniref:Helix-turn-helix psq domain n=1 Tax=Holotrichia oblita TaxID=644536 RepID=A0ACB9T697_HOLOL|nr:helix-turn-helix psq domain [Holotrichia oblita]